MLVDLNFTVYKTGMSTQTNPLKIMLAIKKKKNNARIKNALIV